VCGSVKRNRIGMPSAATLTPAQLAAIARGAHIQMQRGDVTLCAWRDKKLILLLYNHIDPKLQTSMKRWGDDGAIYQLGCPQAICDYFHHARAVDVINQLHYSYLPGRRVVSAGHAWCGGSSTSASSTRSGSGKRSTLRRHTSRSACSWPTSSWSVCRQLGGPSAHLTGLPVLPLWPVIITPSSLPKGGIVLSAASGLISASKPTTRAPLA